MIKKSIFTLITILILVILGLVSAELLTRIKYNNYKSAQDFFFKNKSGTFLEPDNPDCNWSHTLYPHPYLGTVHNNNKISNCITGHTNQDGLPGRDYPKHNPSDSFDILITGGSVAFNLTKIIDGNGSGLLRRTLENNFVASDGREIRVYLGAIGAWKQPQQLFNYINHQEKFDAILSIEGGNEINLTENEKFSSPFTVGYQVAHYPDLNFYIEKKMLKLLYDLNFIITDSYFLSLMTIKYSQLTQNSFFEKLDQSHIRKIFLKNYGNNNIEKANNIEHYFIEQYYKYIKTFQILTKFNNQKFALFFQPTIFHFKTRHQNEESIDLYSPVLKKYYPRVVENLLNKKISNVYSLLDIFEKNNDHIYMDYIHFKNTYNSNPGHEILVKEILNKLKVSWKIKAKSYNGSEESKN